MFNPNYQNMPMMDESSQGPYDDHLRKPYMRNSMPQYDSPIRQIPQGYADGGMIAEPKQRKKKESPYPSLAEMIRQQGKGEDTILAHINPLEAAMLREMGGSGTINPITGLPQFGFLKNPLKAFKGSGGGLAGAIIGNMILPGAGGAIGGALGGAAGSAIRGRKDYAQAGLRGGIMGAALPSAASLLGSGGSALGMDSAGSYLSDYGSNNAIMPSLSRMIGGSPMGVNTGSTDQVRASAGIGNSLKGGGDKGESASWMSSLMKPKNLLTAATLAGSFLNRPKEKSPEKLAQEQKRFNKAAILTPEERAAQETDMLAEEQMRRRIARNKYLPEDHFEVKPLYRSVNTPNEYTRTGKWINYYDNPQMQGNPLLMKTGGMVPQMSYEVDEVESPSGLGFYINGHGGGQEDKVDIKAAQGEFIMPADVVADIGDGNSEAGAKAFYKLIEKVRKHKGKRNKLPPKAKPLMNYMK